MDRNGVLQNVFDGTTLVTTGVAGVSNPAPQPLDENGVWAAVYDAATRTIRVVNV